MSKSIYKTIIKDSIVSGLFLLAILAFGILFIPTSAAHAQSYDEGFDDGYDHFMYPSPNPIPILYSISPKSANAGDNITTITITGHGFKANSVARWNGSDRPTTFIDTDHLIMRLNPNDLTESATNYVNVFNPSRGAYSIAAKFKISGFVAGGTAGNSNGYNPYVDPVSTMNSNNANNGNNANQNPNDRTVSTLASNAIFGVNSLVPNGIIQWILFAIIILMIVILVRKIFGASERYHNSPLKYS